MAAIIIAGLLILTLAVANSFLGNPISRAAAEKAINEHIEKNYSRLNLGVTDVKYSFKFGRYFAHAQSPVSPDTGFGVYYGNGQVFDDYEDYVVGGFNTWVRLEEEFSKVVVPIVERELDYEFDMVLATLNKSGGNMANLTLDMEFDLYNIPLESRVIIYPYTDDFTWSNVAKIAKELDALMLEKRIEIDEYSVILRHKPQGEEKNYDSMGVTDFPREGLAAENLPKAMEDFSQAMETVKDVEK